MKKLNKKLALNKETLASLDSKQMNSVKGGFTYALSWGERCSASQAQVPAAGDLYGCAVGPSY